MAPTAAVPRHNQLPNVLSPPLCAHPAPHLPCSPAGPAPSTPFRNKRPLAFFLSPFHSLAARTGRRRVWRHRMADVLVLAECQRITAGAKTSPCCMRAARNCSLRTPLWMRAAVGTGPRCRVRAPTDRHVCAAICRVDRHPSRYEMRSASTYSCVCAHAASCRGPQSLTCRRAKQCWKMRSRSWGSWRR